jgi:hypothetical protein
VEKGVMAQEMVDWQLYCEARNVIWELSILNPLNQDLSGQTRERPEFLLPSGLANLMLVFRTSVGGAGRRLISPEHFTELRNRVQKLREDTLEIFRRDSDEGGIPMRKDDDKIIQKESNNVKGVILPKTTEDGLTYRTTDPLLEPADRLNKITKNFWRSGPLGKTELGKKLGGKQWW